jgi:hypothetical protein
MTVIADAFVTRTGPTSGATVYAYAADRFTTLPVQGAAPPAGAPDAGPVLAGTQWGGPGEFQISVPADVDYYILCQYSGINYWSLRPAGSASTPPTPPLVTGVSPSSGSESGGDTVTLTGTGLGYVSAVTFGGIAATIVSESDTGVVVTTPVSSVVGTVDVIVTTEYGTTAPLASPGFTYYSYASPTIGSISPASGSDAGATDVTITGTNFVAGYTTVTFNSYAATIVSVTPTSISLITPPSAIDGAVDVAVTVSAALGGSGFPASLLGGFTYTATTSTVPAMPTGGTVTAVGVTYTINASDDFPGDSLNTSNWGAFASNSPGAGAGEGPGGSGTRIFTWPVDNTGLLTVANSTLTLSAGLGTPLGDGTPTMVSAGLGSYGQEYTSPSAVMWCFRRVNYAYGLVDYALEMPTGSGTNWPRYQERDIRESNGNAGNSAQTLHGSQPGATAGNEQNLSAGGIHSTTDVSQWTIGLSVLTGANGVWEVYYGPSIAGLTLASQITAADVTAAGIQAVGGGAFDVSFTHAFDLAVELEYFVNAVPAGFTNTPTPIMQYAWVLWLTPT